MPTTKPARAPTAEAAARKLYADILRCWNARDAGSFAQLFTRNGNMVGFDGQPGEWPR